MVLVCGVVHQVCYFKKKIVLSSLPITLLCTVKLGSTMSSTDLMVNDSHENID